MLKRVCSIGLLLLIVLVFPANLLAGEVQQKAVKAVPQPTSVSPEQNLGPNLSDEISNLQSQVNSLENRINSLDSKYASTGLVLFLFGSFCAPDNVVDSYFKLSVF